MDTIIQIAVHELGQKEIAGSVNNPSIVNYAKEAGFPWVDDDETPWCSIFVNWVAKKAHLNGSRKIDARSWLQIGLIVDDSPNPGDIVIFWRESITSWKGHVGIFFGYSKDKKRVFCLGGNQGNQVSITAFPSDNVLGFRRLKKTQILRVPDIILKIGDTGNDVKLLQDALKAVNINCGTSDGYFGPMTKAAVEQLQTMKYGLAINGVFTIETNQFLNEILKQ